MAELSSQARYSIARQNDMFLRAERDHGLSVAEIARKSGISASTLKGWKNGSAMPAWAFGELGLPDDLLSMVLDAPFGKFVGTSDEDEGDLDELATMCSAFLTDYSRARHPNSPGGIAIVHTEKATLSELRQRLRAHARRNAA